MGLGLGLGLGDCMCTACISEVHAVLRLLVAGSGPPTDPRGAARSSAPGGDLRLRQRGGPKLGLA